MSECNSPIWSMHCCILDLNPLQSIPNFHFIRNSFVGQQRKMHSEVTSMISKAPIKMLCFVRKNSIFVASFKLLALRGEGLFLRFQLFNAKAFLTIGFLWSFSALCLFLLFKNCDWKVETHFVMIISIFHFIAVSSILPKERVSFTLQFAR